jgi:hypothetical protein
MDSLLGLGAFRLWLLGHGDLHHIEPWGRSRE